MLQILPNSAFYFIADPVAVKTCHVIKNKKRLTSFCELIMVQNGDCELKMMH
jgi:hypothetical protein